MNAPDYLAECPELVITGIVTNVWGSLGPFRQVILQVDPGSHNRTDLPRRLIVTLDRHPVPGRRIQVLGTYGPRGPAQFSHDDQLRSVWTTKDWEYL